MQIIFSPRGNGACPLCQRRASCHLLDKIHGALDPVKGSNGTEMEFVIYSCPLFVETA
jgi:hypothetical protein